MLNTRFTRLVGCAVPIQQAGMGSLATPALAAAVASAPLGDAMRRRTASSDVGTGVVVKAEPDGWLSPSASIRATCALHMWRPRLRHRCTEAMENGGVP